MAKIAVVNVPFYSHGEAATRLTGVLVRQGHEVIAWGPAWCQAAIESLGAAFRLQEPQMPDVTGFMSYAASLVATTEQLSEILIQDLFEHDVDLVIHDSQVPWARVAGDFLGLPRIVAHPMFPLISPIALGREEDEIPTLEPEMAKAQFDAHWLSIAKRWGVELGELDGVIHSANVSETTVVAFTTPEICGATLEPNWHFIGPLMDPVPSTRRPGERPLVYVCLGTSFNTRATVFEAVVEGLADEPADVLISMGGGELSAADFGPLPANIEVRDFVPGREVLSRASVHVTHGGNNSVHESLLAGVPMLCVPQAFDQFPLTARIQGLGAGAVVEEAPDAFREGVRWLLTDEGPHDRAQELAEHLTNYDGEGHLAALIEQVLDGAALRA